MFLFAGPDEMASAIDFQPHYHPSRGGERQHHQRGPIRPDLPNPDVAGGYLGQQADLLLRVNHQV